MTHGTAPYRFLPLPEDGDSIRLLRVRPAPAYASPVSCALEVARLSDGPAFVSLSYSWGEAVLDRAIAVDGAGVRVTESLDCALRMFRKTGAARGAAEGGGGLLWADQICINQGDDRERSLQVRMMRRIYETSKAVVISFGDGEGDAPVLVNELLSHVSRKKAKLEAESPGASLSPSDVILKRHWPHWRAFVQQLMLHRYCSRVWVVQEIIFGGTAFILYGGERVEPFSWATFVAVVQLSAWVQVQIDKTAMAEGREEEYEKCVAPGTTMANVAMIGQLGQEDWKLRFLPLVVNLRSLQSTDPRDRIFGLQSLAKDAHVYSKADYNKSVEEVFTDFGRGTVKSQEDGFRLGELLAEAALHKQGLDLPSWVPDWTNAGHGALNFHSDHYIEDETFQLVRFSDQHTVTYPVEVREVAGRCALAVRGRIVDPIEVLSPQAPAGEDWEHCAEEFEAWDETCRSLLKRYLEDTGEADGGLHESEEPGSKSDLDPTILSRFAKLLTSGLLDPLPYYDKVNFSAEEILEGYLLNKRVHISTKTSDPAKRRLRRFYTTAFAWTKRAYRRLAITTKRDLAIVPFNTVVGDRMGFIDGYRCAVVLRKDEFEGNIGWKLVGDSYVEGGLEVYMKSIPGKEPESFLLT